MRRYAGNGADAEAAMLLRVAYSGVLMFDVLFTACVLGAITPLVSVNSSLLRKQWLIAGAWLSLGLFTKEPTALISWGVIVVTAPYWRGQVTLVWWKGVGLALAVLILLAWALALLAARELQ